jgi:hypothetical protein
MSDLDKILKAFKHTNLKLNPAKCVFATQKCEYLGHEFSQGGVTPSKSHVEAVKSYPVPKTIPQVRTFNGLCCFFKQFIPNRAELMAPLTAMTKKDAKYNWTKQCQVNFDKLKDILTSEAVLMYPNWSKRFFVATDASLQSLGSCLLQKDDKTGKLRPVAYGGRALTPHEKKVGIMQLETLAAVYAITNWDVYLSHKPFTLLTDNSALKHVLNSKTKMSAKVQRWSLYLSAYDFDCIHIKGLSNSCADSLSRRPYDFDWTAVDDKMINYPDIPGINAILKTAATVSTKNDNTVNAITRSEAAQIKQDAETEIQEMQDYLDMKGQNIIIIKTPKVQKY